MWDRVLAFLDRIDARSSDVEGPGRRPRWRGEARFLFAGDLNEESETELAEAHGRGEVDLRSEVLKVPHHGSHDFLPFDAIRATATPLGHISLSSFCDTGISSTKLGASLAAVVP